MSLVAKPGTEVRRANGAGGILAISLSAQAASCVFLYGLPFLVPEMHGRSLAAAGVIVAAPTIGLMLTLVAWGAAADRYGERLVMALGLGASGLLVGAAALAQPGTGGEFVLFLLAGACGASVNAASGRAVMGWFGPAERGIAMGIRQTAQPLGVGIAALALPPLARHWGFYPALLFPAGFALVIALLVAWLVLDPPRAPKRAVAAKPASPYRRPALWRLHAASALLVVPQFAVSAFGPVYLVSVQHFSPVTAGWFLAGVQVLGAAGRLASGYWSDRVGSRLRPMRQLAVASAAVMLLVALGDVTGCGWYCWRSCSPE